MDRDNPTHQEKLAEAKALVLAAAATSKNAYEKFALATLIVKSLEIKFSYLGIDAPTWKQARSNSLLNRIQAVVDYARKYRPKKKALVPPEVALGTYVGIEISIVDNTWARFNDVLPQAWHKADDLLRPLVTKYCPEKLAKWQKTVEQGLSHSR